MSISEDLLRSVYVVVQSSMSNQAESIWLGAVRVQADECNAKHQVSC